MNRDNDNSPAKRRRGVEKAVAYSSTSTPPSPSSPSAFIFDIGSVDLSPSSGPQTRKAPAKSPVSPSNPTPFSFTPTDPGPSNIELPKTFTFAAHSESAAKDAETPNISKKDKLQKVYTDAEIEEALGQQDKSVNHMSPPVAPLGYSFASSFNDPNLSDCKLILIHEEDGKVEKRELWVSRFLLTADGNGKYFRTLFYGKMKEQGKPEIEIRLDSKIDYFVDLIYYLYVGAFKSANEEMLEIWRLADQYDLSRASLAAIQILGHGQMTVCTSMALAILSNPLRDSQQLQHLTRKALHFITNSFSMAVSLPLLQQFFSRIPLDALLFIQQFPEFCNHSETARLGFIVEYIRTNQAELTVQDNDRLLLAVRVPYLSRTTVAFFFKPLISDLLKKKLISEETFKVLRARQRRVQPLRDLLALERRQRGGVALSSYLVKWPPADSAVLRGFKMPAFNHYDAKISGSDLEWKTKTSSHPTSLFAFGIEWTFHADQMTMILTPVAAFGVPISQVPQHAFLPVRILATVSKTFFDKGFPKRAAHPEMEHVSTRTLLGLGEKEPSSYTILKAFGQDDSVTLAFCLADGEEFENFDLMPSELKANHPNSATAKLTPGGFPIASLPEIRTPQLEVGGGKRKAEVPAERVLVDRSQEESDYEDTDGSYDSESS